MSDTAITLRRATTADADAVRDLTRTAYAEWVEVLGREPLPMQADCAQAIAAHRIDCLWLDGVLAGLIEMAEASDHLLIVNVAVRPGMRKRGLGRSLLAHAEEVAVSLDRPEVRLYANALMAGNLALYDSLGYREDRRETGALGVVVHMSKAPRRQARSGGV